MSDKDFSQNNYNEDIFHNNSKRFLEDIMLSDNIFDQLFDEDDEDDEFKPDNFENDEEDDEELSNESAISIEDEDNLGISLRTRKRHILSEDANFQLDDDVFDWELSTFQDMDDVYVTNQMEGEAITYLYPNQIVEIDIERLKNIREQFSRHFQLLIQIFLLSKMSDNMFSVTLGTWQLLVFLFSKYSNQNSLYYIQGIEIIEQLQPLIHQRDKLDENTFRNYLSLFSNNFYEDLLPWKADKKRK